MALNFPASPANNATYTASGVTYVYNSDLQSWRAQVAGVAGPTVPGGSTTQVQFNDAGSFNGDSGLTYDKTTDTLTTVGLVVTNRITANGGSGSAGQVLLSGGGTANAYWGAAGVTAGGSDTYVQFNDGGSALGGTAGFTFTKTSNTLTVANTFVTKNITANGIFTANGATGSAGQFLTSAGGAANAYWSTVSTTAPGSDTQVVFNDGGTAYGADAGMTYNKTTDTMTLAGALVVGNSTVNSSHTTTLVSVANSTASANLSPNALTVGTSVVNTTVLAAGANVVANTSALFVGNSTVNSTHTQALVQVSNSTSTSNLTATSLAVGANVTLGLSSLAVGNSTVNATFNQALVQVTNSTGTANLTATSFNIGANVSANVTALYVGNTSVNAIHTSSLFQVANSTSTANLTATSLNIGANVVVGVSAISIGNSTVNTTINSTTVTARQLSANGSVGTAGQVLTSGATGNAYWTTVAGAPDFLLFNSGII